ncbi:hypothetical protein ABTY59_33605 [Streptomyces sp. NPDC096079]|uniref:hypothetical protein n=1 Tax=Streptomyces sp. NPDC096079 TaxID=3155820 RepID=UPI0033269860
MISIMKELRRLGPKKGTRFRPASYNPDSGAQYRPGSNFDPEEAMKLLAICEAVDMSVAGFLNRMIELMDIDPETNVPVGWPQSVALKEAS